VSRVLDSDAIVASTPSIYRSAVCGSSVAVVESIFMPYDATYAAINIALTPIRR